jgi:hypothetical protein
MILTRSIVVGRGWTLWKERTMKMTNPPMREKRVYRVNFSIFNLGVSEKVALRRSLLAAYNDKQIVFQRDVPGERLYTWACGRDG